MECWNHLALMVSIFADVSPEDAFHMLETGAPKRYKGQYRLLTDEDMENILRLRETHSHQQIAQMYDMTRYAITNRVSRYLRRVQG